MKTLGTAACPPYHLAFVIGGTSAEFNLKTVKLATAKYLDHLPTEGGEAGSAFRDVALEEQVLKISRELGIGAQFGGTIDTTAIDYTIGEAINHTPNRVSWISKLLV